MTNLLPRNKQESRLMGSELCPDDNRALRSGSGGQLGSMRISRLHNSVLSWLDNTHRSITIGNSHSELGIIMLEVGKRLGTRRQSKTEKTWPRVDGRTGGGTPGCGSLEAGRRAPGAAERRNGRVIDFESTHHPIQRPHRLARNNGVALQWFGGDLINLVSLGSLITSDRGVWRR